MSRSSADLDPLGVRWPSQWLREGEQLKKLVAELTLDKAMLQDVLARSPKGECALAIEESLKREGWVPQPSNGTGGPSWMGHMPRLMFAVFLLGEGPLGEALLVPPG